ncbi:MAG: ABC transporter ATP-binding protein [Candidatus Verstraetearchaeota archaeon]|nr:ABC transporter ATP-binding protein [Candidatus Verstraetearchaeota archaeon]RLE54926.1 MAG: ABC transporter ATP-binding protein [Candidatus Verstraetearchaeota archaeon]
MPIIRVKGLSYRYPGSSRTVLKNITLNIDEGEYVVITGPSGCGKTTLCRCFNGLIPHFYGGNLEGEIIVNGFPVKETSTSTLAQYVGMVFQEPESQLFLLSVEREVAFGLENLGLPREEIVKRVDEALKLVGISHLRDRAPHELSGGEQQKVALAACIAMQPKILVLDEPTANLDPISAVNILNLLQSLRNKLGVTIILVEHRLEAVASVADRFIVMNDGMIVSDGDPRDVLSSTNIEGLGVGVPKVIQLYKDLKRRNVIFNLVPLTPKEVKACLMEVLEFD